MATKRPVLFTFVSFDTIFFLWEIVPQYPCFRQFDDKLYKHSFWSISGILLLHTVFRQNSKFIKIGY